MERVDVKVGFQCNNMCLFCVQGNKRERFDNRTDEEIQEILRQGRDEGRGEVVFTGGEPTFRPKSLIEWVKYAKEIGYESIQIQTNGRMLSYMGFCEALIEAGANEFSPAVHGSKAEIHDRLTGAAGSFGQVTKGIMNLKKLRQRVMTNSVVTKINYKDLPDLARLLVSLHVDQFQFAFIHINPIIGGNKEKIEMIVPKVSDAIPFIREGLDIGIKSGTRCMTEAVPYCMMIGYEKYVAERIMPEVHVFDAEEDIKDYSKYRQNQGKAKGPRCKECSMNGECEGPWKEYPEIFGWDEFEPVAKQK